jgi:mycoredoxin
MTIKVYTIPWCPDYRMAKQFLHEWGIEYEEVNIDEHPEAAQHVIQLNNGKRKVPTLELDGRSFACSPFDLETLREGLGPLLNK